MDTLINALAATIVIPHGFDDYHLCIECGVGLLSGVCIKHDI
ncbi:hypothetical protein [Vreelandella alkaliphila]|nr:MULTISPECIES: hypothetical protein [Halomonas]